MTDEDCPPPLESLQCRENSPPDLENSHKASAKMIQLKESKEEEEKGVMNPAEDETCLMEQMMQDGRDAQLAKTQRARERRKKEDTSFGKGLKKGFFDTTKKKTTDKKTSSTILPKKVSLDDGIETIRPKTNVPNFQFPEVQAALQGVDSKGK